jgi:transposase InsO family protein
MSDYYQKLIIKMRLSWFALYEQTNNVSFVCRHFGISRKTFYKWYKRFNENNKDIESLKDRTSKPINSPKKTDILTTHLIINIREKTRFGPDRIKFYLYKCYHKNVPRSTIYVILKREGLINKTKRRKKKPILYNLPNPGDNIQLDIKYVNGYSSRKIVQYSAIDDCTRIKFVKLYTERTNHNSLDFLLTIVSKFPFKIKQITTDNDSVFTNKYTGETKTSLFKEPSIHEFTIKCEQLGIHHKLNPPGNPQKNGKVERSHRTDEEEFWRILQLKITSSYDFSYINKALKAYINFYNNHRPHMGIGGLTPLQKLRSFDMYKSVTNVFS